MGSSVEWVIGTRESRLGVQPGGTGWVCGPRWVLVLRNFGWHLAYASLSPKAPVLGSFPPYPGLVGRGLRGWRDIWWYSGKDLAVCCASRSRGT